MRRVEDVNLCHASTTFVQTRGRTFDNIEREIARRGLRCGALAGAGVAAQPIETAASPEPAASAPTITTARATGAVNMRAGPGTQHATLGSLRVGDEVIVLSVDGAWCECMRARQVRFFVNCRYLTAPAGGWASVGRLGTASGRPQGEAERFLRDLYARLASDQQPSFDWKPLLASETRSAWMRAYNADGGHTYDFDPVCNCQDSGGLRVTNIRIISEVDGRALVDVSFDFPLAAPPQTSTVRFLLIREHEGWRILDVRYPQSGERLRFDSIRRRLGLSVAHWEALASSRAGATDISSPLRFTTNPICSFSPQLDAAFDQMLADRLSRIRRPLILAGMRITPRAHEGGQRDTDSHVIDSAARMSQPVVWNGLTVVSLFAQNGWETTDYGLIFSDPPTQVQQTLARLGVAVPLGNEGREIPTTSCSARLSVVSEGSGSRLLCSSGC